ncbi:hypothetical protein ACWEO2_26305 [Nocardia sp. NPDC004278]
MSKIAAAELYEFQGMLYRNTADELTGRSGTSEHLIYQKYGRLFDFESLAADHRQLAIDPDNLFVAQTRNFTQEFINLAVKPIAGEAAREAESLRIRVNDSFVTMTAALRIADTASRSLSRTIVGEVDGAIASNLEPIYGRLHEKVGKFASGLGYAGQSAMYAACQGVDFAELANECREYALRTASHYRHLLSSCAEEFLGLPVSRLDKMDAPRLWGQLNRLASHNSDSILAAVANSSGFAREQRLLKIIRVEDGDFRSRCLPVAVPDEVYVFINSKKGAENIFLSAHEIGHGVAVLAQPSAGGVDLARWQDPVVGEAIATLHEDMALWHISNTRTECKALHRLYTLKRLYLIRIHIAKFLWQLEFADASDDAIASIGTTRLIDQLKANTLFDFAGATPMYYLDLHWYASVYLRGWMLAAQLRSRLSAELGPNWPDQPQTGELVKDCLDGAMPVSANLVSCRSGYRRLDSVALIEAAASSGECLV